MPVIGLVPGPTLVRRKSCTSGAGPNRRRRYKVIDLFTRVVIIEGQEWFSVHPDKNISPMLDYI